MSDPALMLFAKQPLAGQVKTRLQPQYTPVQAAEIGEILIRETVKLAALNWTGQIYLCGAPSTDHPLFHELARSFDVSEIDQGGGDLGERMQRAMVHGIAVHGAAALLGCDVPHCPHEVLHRAHAILANGGNALGPTEDGGYYLIGLTAARAELFADIVWGGADVCATTLERARMVGVRFDMLPTLRDIDTPADVHAVGRAFEPLRRFLYI